MITSPPSAEVQTWPIDRLVFYVRNPRKNDAAVDRMCGSIREFGFKVPVLARSDGEVVDGPAPLMPCQEGSWSGALAAQLIAFPITPLKRHAPLIFTGEPSSPISKFEEIGLSNGHWMPSYQEFKSAAGQGRGEDTPAAE